MVGAGSIYLNWKMIYSKATCDIAEGEEEVAVGDEIAEA